MALQGPGNRYEVVERESFAADWERGVEEGWINPMADHVTLQIIKERLSDHPWATRPISGWPANARAITFPRSVVNQQDTVDIYYEILEDDGKVWLERILPTFE